MLDAEDDWLRTLYPGELLRHAGQAATPRKLRLFGCHCCRRLGPLLPRGPVRDALTTAERFADGLATADELRAGWLAVRQALSRAPLDTKWEHALDAALHATTPDYLIPAEVSRNTARALGGGWCDPVGRPVVHAPPNLQECAAHCAILRDLLPFRPPAALRPAWLAWEGGQLGRLAAGIRDEGRFDDLPVLADALEEAGCDDPRLLAHARGPEPHFNGCWLLDLILLPPQADGVI